MEGGREGGRVGRDALCCVVSMILFEQPRYIRAGRADVADDALRRKGFPAGWKASVL